MKRRLAPALSNVWLAQHRGQLERHVEQCWSRWAQGAAAHGLDSVHAALRGRFVTMVSAMAVVMLLPSLWS